MTTIGFDHDGNIHTWRRLTPEECLRGRRAMEAVMEKAKPVTFVFEDDGLVPNNPLVRLWRR